ncbi:MAG TPA: amidohydrolase family protein [Rudaea sp.]|nr:amidohydrolase family protein [Rudaea sp.]
MNRRRCGLLSVILATLAACTTTPATRPGVAQLAIVGVTVVNPERDGADAAMADATVVISGDRIAAVGPRASTAVPAGATRIDGTGKWLIPGLIDGHVHFFQSGNLYTRPDAADFNAVVPYAQEVARNKARLPATFKVWLASGVTGVIDIGGPFWNFDMRDVADRTAVAPRVEVAGPLISMVDRVKLDLGDPPIIRIESPEAARALVARELERKPDFIKVWFIHQKGDDLARQEAIVKAAGDAAHAAHLRLAVHATELDVAKASLRAGADYLVHSVFEEPIDDEFIALMRKNHALLCPTLFVRNGYAYALSDRWQATPDEQRLADPQILAAMHDLEKMPKDKIPPRVAKLMADQPAINAPTIAEQNLKKLWDAGIPIVMGTDAGNIGTLHGPSVFREMALMRDAGLTPLQVLRSATTNGARAMGRTDIGAVAPGKLADLVLLDADPLADVGNFSHADRVIKGGVVYEPKALIESIRQ